MPTNTKTPTSLPVTPRTTVKDLIQMSMDAESILEQVRERMLNPYPRKTPPELSAFQVAGLCGIDRTKLKQLEASIKSTRGTAKPGHSFKTYTLKEAIELSQQIGNGPKRPTGKKGKVIAITSYKGGVGKTTSAVTIAQGLTLKGLKVLLLGLDGQGSATMLMGVSPEVEVNSEQTAMGFIYRDHEDLRYAVQDTYWHNLHLIPESSALLMADMVMPSNQKVIPGYEYWKQLAIGVEPLRDEFDVIVVDTSPSLGYLTQNAMYLADMIFAPCPEQALDYASLCQFWQVYVELASKLPGFLQEKQYDAVEVFVTKAKPDSDETSATIKDWLRSSFGKNLCEVSVPESSIPQKASSEMKTVYDLTGKDISSSAYKRYKEPVDDLVSHICEQLTLSWRR